VQRFVPLIDEVVSEDEFIKCLSAEFGSSSPLKPDAQLVEDLQFDSLDMVNLIVYIEEVSGVTHIADAEIYPVIRTVRDAYLYLLDLKGEDPDEPEH